MELISSPICFNTSLASFKSSPVIFGITDGSIICCEETSIDIFWLISSFVPGFG